MEFLNDINDIYKRLGDEISQNIYSYRLLYNLTNDPRWLRELLSNVPEFMEIRKALSENRDKKIVYGAGLTGREIVRLNPDYSYVTYVDNKLAGKRIDNLSVISGDELLANYSGECVVITPWRSAEVIEKELVAGGVPIQNIVNVGRKVKILLNKQYFDLPYMKPSKDEFFVDCGVLDGESSKNFAKWANGNYRHIYLFEPDNIYRQATENNLKTAGLDNWTISSSAVWSHEEDLFFTDNIPEGGSHVKTSGGGIYVHGVALDNALMNENPTFIKMDIEGAEKQALTGAKNILSGIKPKLAISLYHRPEDVLEIPRLILSYNDDYKFYLRHYSIGEWETVLFAI